MSENSRRSLFVADDYFIKFINRDELKTGIQSVVDVKQLQSQESINFIKDEYGLAKNIEVKISPKDKDFLGKFEKIIEEKFSDENLNLNAIANKANTGCRTLQKKIKALLGKKPIQYLREYRLEQAKKMLLADDLKIGELAEKVGFSSQQYFTKCFKAYCGVTPKAYRNKYFK